jgi:hypothetical protein
VKWDVVGRHIPLAAWCSLPLNPAEVPKNYDTELPSASANHALLCCRWCSKYHPVKLQLKKHMSRCRLNPKVLKVNAKRSKAAGKKRVVHSDEEDEDPEVGPVRTSTRKKKAAIYE